MSEKEIIKNNKLIAEFMVEYKEDKPYINVSCEQINFTPIN